MPRVPSELQPRVTDDVLGVVAKWNKLGVAGINEFTENMATVVETAYGPSQIGIDRPADWDGTDLIVALPHQQIIKPSMGLRVGITRDIVAPHSRAIALPGNGRLSTAYAFTPQERDRLRGGDSKPLADRHTSILDVLGVQQASLAGYSLGGFVVINVLAHGPQFRVKGASAIEVPSRTGRDPQQLQKHFLSSGSYVSQRRALKDSTVEALPRNVLSPARLIADYIRFAQNAKNPDNTAIHHVMAGSIQRLLDALPAGAPLSLGYVEGSNIFDPASVQLPPGIALLHYTGAGTRRHPTGDNPVAHALMAQDGIQRAA